MSTGRNSRIAIVLLLVSLASCATDNLEVSRPAKRIALTFDDAPRGNGPRYSGEQRAAILIDALREAKTGPVAFFVKTSNFDRAGGIQRIARYASAGHLIANHTHSHSWLSRTEPDDYISDVDEAELLLKGFDNRRAWFRYPYLDEGRSIEKRDALSEALDQRHLMNGYVTVDNYDWYLEAKWQEAVDQGRSVDIEALRRVYVEILLDAAMFYDDLAVRTLKRSPAHVLLLHENDVAATFIGDLVTAFRKKSWEIVSPDEAYEDPMVSQIPTTLRTGQGRVAALAIDAGLDPRTLSHFAIEETMIDALLEERKVFGTVE